MSKPLLEHLQKPCYFTLLARFQLVYSKTHCIRLARTWLNFLISICYSKHHCRNANQFPPLFFSLALAVPVPLSHKIYKLMKMQKPITHEDPDQPKSTNTYHKHSCCWPKLTASCQTHTTNWLTHS